MVRKIGVLKNFVKEIEEEISNWKFKMVMGDDYWTPKMCEKEIKRCNKQLNKANEELKTYEDYEASKNVPTIIEFFDKWEERQREWFGGVRKNYVQKMKEFSDMKEKILKDNDIIWGNCLKGEERDKYEKIKDEEYKFQLEWRNVEEFIVSRTDDGFNKGLDKYISITKENLMYDLFNRIYKAIGKIVDTSCLSVGMSNFGPVINGFIKGENGRANITTIDAGGYNIQKYHFRVLIKIVDKNGNKIKKSDWNK